MNLTAIKLYEDIVKKFIDADIPEAKENAKLMLMHYCDISANDLLVHGEKEISKEDEEKLYEAVKRRLTREPLQYITGTAPFMGLDFKVDKNVLIPRPDTEILVEEALRNLNDGSRILDLCTGSGCILISLLKYSNDCKGVGTDISEGALGIARENARVILGEDNNAEFLEGDLFEALPGDTNDREKNRFEMIVSNPPYIATDVIETLMPEVRDYEPRLALDGTGTGLLFYERIIPTAKDHLTVGGQLLLEIGYDQGEAVKDIMDKNGYIETNIIKDYAGNDRVVTGIKSVYL